MTTKVDLRSARPGDKVKVLNFGSSGDTILTLGKAGIWTNEEGSCHAYTYTLVPYLNSGRLFLLSDVELLADAFRGLP